MRTVATKSFLKMTRPGFRNLYFIRRTSQDFENNRKILLMERNRPLLESDALHTQKSRPAPVLDFNSVSHRNYKSSKKPLFIVEASLKIF